MTFNMKAWGHGVETLGLVFILLGAFWQGFFSGWWDREMPEWQYYIQEEVNLAVLNSLKILSNMQIVDDKNTKEQAAKNLADIIDKAYSFAINERTKRQTIMKSGQAALFWNIQNYLVMLGALCLVIGKWLIFSSLKS